MAKYKAKVNTKEVEDTKNKKKNTKKSTNKNNDKKVVKVQKPQKIKNTVVLTEEQEQIKKFIITLIIVIVLVVGLFLLSSLIVDKREGTNNTTDDSTEVEITYDTASVGMILNRPYDSYYVIVYDSTDNKAIYYSTLISKYSQKDDALKIYFTDLNDGINKKYKSTTDTGNVNVIDNISEFSFGKLTLLKVSKGKVVNYYESIEDIEGILK